MLSKSEFIRLSLELNLFFARIAKEHSIFMQSGFAGKNTKLIHEADNFKIQFEQLLAETIALADGIISPEAEKAGEFVTKYTLDAERVSQFYTGIRINMGLTKEEISMDEGPGYIHMPMLEQRVYMLNQKAIALTTALADFKERILRDVLACKLFTTNYPLLLDHVLREAKLYLRMLTKLQNFQRIDTEKDFVEQEIFWDRIMGEHGFFIRGLLDPTEVDLFNTANKFGYEFEELSRRAMEATEQTLPQITDESLTAARGIRDFKAAATEGLINCKIKAIAYPLLGDHVLREANHFIRLLRRNESL